MAVSIFDKIRRAVHMFIPYKSIEEVERVRTPLSQEMIQALDLWHNMYHNRAPWLADPNVTSLNLPAFVSSELARQITLEMEWNITSDQTNGSGDLLPSPRSEFLSDEFKRLMRVLRRKVELGVASGGLLIKPYVRNGHIYFDACADWEIYPLAFGDDNDLTDVIFPDYYAEGEKHYTRLERHRLEYDRATGTYQVHITQRAFLSNTANNIGTEIPLSSVPRWAEITPDTIVRNSGGMLFGWFCVASANSVDSESPMGSSCFAKAVDMIAECDRQYSRLAWEFEGSELAIDVDPMVLRPKQGGKDGQMEMPKLNQRLFRAVDAAVSGEGDMYSVFSPAIRDQSILNGLYSMMQRVEDLCGMSRGTIAQLDHTTDAKTATELRIMRQRSYATVADNQQALQRCLEDVIRVMDFYATEYHLAPEGEYECSFEWDDSIMVDSEQQLNERLTLLNAGVENKVGMRMWYFGETEAQAKAAIERANQEAADQMMAMSGGSVDEYLPQAPALSDTEGTDEEGTRDERTRTRVVERPDKAEEEGRA